MLRKLVEDQAKVGMVSKSRQSISGYQGRDDVAFGPENLGIPSPESGKELIKPWKL